MNFSEQWRSLWPVASVPHAPNLISGDRAAAFHPVVFHPSPQRHLLHASSSIALPIPPSLSKSMLYDIQSFFRCGTNGSFLPIADQYNMAADIQSSLVSAASNSRDPLSGNNLHALPCHDGFSLILFFPTGDNADEIGFLCLRFGDDSLKPEVVVDLCGDIFKQREGLKHPRHRILKLSVISSPADCSSPTDNTVIEGFLLASTMYSVNWFRVETQITDEGKLRPLLIPLAKQGFLSCVVDACWSPHLLEESAVLLESGELCWFNLVSKRGGTHKILIGGNADPGRWLGCKFGGQPWVILVASSVVVVLIDLRPKMISKTPKVLARVRLPDFLGVISMEEEKDDFQAFSPASFNDFLFAIVTEKLLLLFDIRQPLVPVLTWDHGLEHPTYISMFRLSELRRSKEFKCAIESSFVILVGSFWKNEFRLFCYGSNDKGAVGSSFFAWELPSSLSLSGRSSRNDFLIELILMEKHLNQEMLLRNNGVAGFCIVSPNILLKCRSETDGFILVRLMLSGKLEIQKYHSDCCLQNETSIWQGVDFQEVEEFTEVNDHEASKVSSRFPFLKLRSLSNYLNQSQSNILNKTYLALNSKGGGYKIKPNDEKFIENTEFFDVSSMKLDFEPLDVLLQPTELSFLKSLNRQASKWLANNQSYQSDLSNMSMPDDSKRTWSSIAHNEEGNGSKDEHDNGAKAAPKSPLLQSSSLTQFKPSRKAALILRMGEWFADTAKAAIIKLLLGTLASESLEVDNDEPKILHDEFTMWIYDMEELLSSPSSTIELLESFSSANNGETENRNFFYDPRPELWQRKSFIFQFYFSSRLK